MRKKYELNMALSKEKAKKRIEMGDSLKRQDFLLVNTPALLKPERQYNLNIC